MFSFIIIMIYHVAIFAIFLYYIRGDTYMKKEQKTKKEMNKEDNIVYANSIKKYRIINGLTQEQVAQIVGFDTKYLSQLECGKYMGTIKTMLKICDALCITPNDLLYDFIKDSNSNKELNEFSQLFSKLSKKNKKHVLTLMKSMLDE